MKNLFLKISYIVTTTIEYLKEFKKAFICATVIVILALYFFTPLGLFLSSVLGGIVSFFIATILIFLSEDKDGLKTS